MSTRLACYGGTFEANENGYELFFDKCKNAQGQQGNKVLVASSPLVAVSPVHLMRELQMYIGGLEGLHVFRAGLPGGWLLKPAHECTGV